MEKQQLSSPSPPHEVSTPPFSFPFLWCPGQAIPAASLSGSPFLTQEFSPNSGHGAYPSQECLWAQVGGLASLSFAFAHLSAQ